MKQNLRKGVTLLELILVIAIIAILFAAIFVALDPARRLAESRNARRWTDVTAIADAIAKYRVDNAGAHYSTVDALTAGEYALIGTETENLGCQNTSSPFLSAATLCARAHDVGFAADDCVDLSAIGANYLADLPFDPTTGSDLFTEYYISSGTLGEITVGSCDAEAEDAGGSGTAPTIEIIR